MVVVHINLLHLFYWRWRRAFAPSGDCNPLLPLPYYTANCLSISGSYAYTSVFAR